MLYRLAPWPEHHAIRRLEHYDEVSEELRAADRRDRSRDEGRRRLALLLSPLAGLLPADIQKKMERDFGAAPALILTIASAVPLFLIGFLGLVAFLIGNAGGTLDTPGWITPSLPIALYLFGESALRLASAIAGQEPMGSLPVVLAVTVWRSLRRTKEPAPAPATRPRPVKRRRADLQDRFRVLEPVLAFLTVASRIPRGRTSTRCAADRGGPAGRLIANTLFSLRLRAGDGCLDDPWLLPVGYLGWWSSPSRRALAQRGEAGRRPRSDRPSFARPPLAAPPSGGPGFTAGAGRPLAARAANGRSDSHGTPCPAPAAPGRPRARWWQAAIRERRGGGDGFLDVPAPGNFDRAGGLMSGRRPGVTDADRRRKSAISRVPKALRLSAEKARWSARCAVRSRLAAPGVERIKPKHTSPRAFHRRRPCSRSRRPSTCRRSRHAACRRSARWLLQRARSAGCGRRAGLRCAASRHVGELSARHEPARREAHRAGFRTLNHRSARAAVRQHDRARAASSGPSTSSPISRSVNET